MPVSRRVVLDPGAGQGLLRRQAVWAGGQALAAAGLGAVLGRGNADLGLLLSLAVGLICASGQGIGRASLVGLALVGAGLAAALWSGPGSTLGGALGLGSLGTWAGATAVVAGAVGGLGLSLIDQGPQDAWRRLHMALAGAATAGLGTWAGAALVPPGAGPALSAGLAGFFGGMVSSQVLTVAALRVRQATRMPPPAVLRSTLQPQAAELCARAWRVDLDLAARAPDPDTRDGLGEVAAWIYRLQLTLQTIDAELVTFDESLLLGRIEELTREAGETQDDFTRERKLATAAHLQQMRGHREALLREKERTIALNDYALAFLDEARLGLTLASVQPGEALPARLPAVLDRLRSFGEERDARRRTARELAAL
jgi:hypothetical protein